MPTIRIEIPAEMLARMQDEVVIRLSADSFQPLDGCKESSGTMFLGFMDEVIDRLKCNGQLRTAESYASARASFRHFLQGSDCQLAAIDAPLIDDYARWLKGRGLRLNTVSYYMRILRAVYNRAVDRSLTPDRRPFRHAYIGVEHTRKRAIGPSEIRRLQLMRDGVGQSAAFAIDMFMFSFYARGMSFVDMAYLRRDDIAGGILTYRRRKTCQRLSMRMEQPLIDIISRYRGPSPRLLPIITSDADPPELQYRRCRLRVNRHLKELGRQLGLAFPLTTYAARHSWATIARDQQVPLNIISQGMGHTSERTTRIYLDSIARDVIDQANRRVISAVSII